MATTIATPAQLLPADRFYRIALFGLVLTAAVALITTGKLDPLTSILAPAAILYKGFRWWRGNGPEWTQTAATRMVVAYVFLFPLDALFVSRSLAAGSPNPALYAVLLAAVHFLLFVTIVRLYSAASDRDAGFLSMLSFAGILASAVFTVDSYFFLFFLIFLSLLFIIALAFFGFLLGLDFRRWRHRRDRIGCLFFRCPWVVNRAVIVRAHGEDCADVFAVDDDGWLRGGAWQGWLSVGVVNDGFYLAELTAPNCTWPLLGGLSPSVFNLNKLGTSGDLTVKEDRDFGLIAISVEALVTLNVIEEGSVVSAAPRAGRASSGGRVKGRVFPVEGRVGE